MKSGVDKHPYLEIKKVSQESVDKLHDKIKTNNPKLYKKLQNKGIRKAADGTTVPAAERTKTFIRVYLEQDGRSFATGKRTSINNMTLDHIVPLSSGGSNAASNLVLIESSLNYIKNNLSVSDFSKVLRNKVLETTTAGSLAKLEKAQQSGNKAEIAKAQKEVNTANTAARLSFDKKQRDEMKKARAEALARRNVFSGKANEYNTVDKLLPLTGKDAIALLKEQGKVNGTITNWQKKEAGSLSKVASRPNIAKLQIFLNSGGKWKDAPEAWKSEMQAAYAKNPYVLGKNLIREQLGKLPDAPEWLV
jgi:hypothetical protein